MLGPMLSFSFKKKIIWELFNSLITLQTSWSQETRASSVSPVWEAGARALGPSSTAFPRPSARDWVRNRTAKTWKVPIWTAGIAGHNANPQTELSKHNSIQLWPTSIVYNSVSYCSLLWEIQVYKIRLLIRKIANIWNKRILQLSGQRKKAYQIKNILKKQGII